MNHEAKIEVYQDKKHQWRWRFVVNQDTQAASTDPFPCANEAEIHARSIICAPWSVESEYKIKISRFSRLVNFLKRIFF